MTSSGKFSGSTQVSKKEFVTTTNKATKEFICCKWWNSKDNIIRCCKNIQRL